MWQSVSQRYGGRCYGKDVYKRQNLGAVQKSIIDRCTASVYRTYQQNNYTGEVPTLQDFRAELLKQSEPDVYKRQLPFLSLRFG